MLLQPAGGRKVFPTVCWILKYGFLRYKNKQAFLVGKNVLIVMVPILINKDVFEPSYNDLKFIVWNFSYFCINLIVALGFYRLFLLLLFIFFIVTPWVIWGQLSSALRTGWHPHPFCSVTGGNPPPLSTPSLQGQWCPGWPSWWMWSEMKAADRKA